MEEAVDDRSHPILIFLLRNCYYRTTFGGGTNSSQSKIEKSKSKDTK